SFARAQFPELQSSCRMKRWQPLCRLKCCQRLACFTQTGIGNAEIIRNLRIGRVAPLHRFQLLDSLVIQQQTRGEASVRFPQIEALRELLQSLSVCIASVQKLSILLLIFAELDPI